MKLMQQIPFSTTYTDTVKYKEKKNVQRRPLRSTKPEKKLKEF